MASSKAKYVVLGGGQAAGYAAKAFVDHGIKPGELMIIGAEQALAYERPTLSKGYLKLEGAPKPPNFNTTVGGGGEIQTADWYKEKGIEYRTGTKVVEANLADHQLTTESGDKIQYEKLIVATGSEVVRLTSFGVKNADLNGIFYLRDMKDADRLVEAMRNAKENGKAVVVIGGGYIGMEVTANIASNGLEATMVFPEDHLMLRLFTPDIAAFYEGYYKSMGVTLVKGRSATAFEDDGAGNVRQVVLDNGDSIKAGLVVVGVGAKLNTDLFKGQLDFLEEKPGGIKVNGSLQTSNPDVYAVGDIAAFDNPYTKSVMRQEHVTNARLSARHAVGAIMAPEAHGSYNYVPYFYSREFDLSWKFYGLNNGEDVLFGDQASGKFGSYWVDDGKVVGIFLEGCSDKEAEAAKCVAELRPAAPDNWREVLRNQGLDFALKVKKRSESEPAMASWSSNSSWSGRSSFKTIASANGNKIGFTGLGSGNVRRFSCSSASMMRVGGAQQRAPAAWLVHSKSCRALPRAVKAVLLCSLAL